MTFNLSFYFLLFLLMCIYLCGKVCATNKALSPSTEKTIELFKKNYKNDVICPSGDENEKKQVNVKEYYSPFLFLTNNIFFAAVGVINTTNNENDIIILTNYTAIKNNDDNWGEQIVKSSDGSVSWKTQIGTQKIIQEGNEDNAARGFIAVAKKNENIYFLLVNCTNDNTESLPDADSAKNKCQFQIDMTTVANSDQLDKTIKCEKSKETLTLTPDEVNLSFEKTSECKYPIFGSAFLINEDKIIFVVHIKTAKNKYTTVLVRSEDAKDKFKLLSINEISEGCYPYIFLWNENIIKLTTGCNKNEKAEIKESTNMGEKWDVSQEPLTRLANFLKDKKDFISVNLKDEKFILFTEDIAPQDLKEEKNLWISDGTRAKSLGKIAFDFKDVAFYKLFYINGELFLVTEQCVKEKVEGICLTRLKEHVAEIKKVLNVWKSNENKIEKLCNNNQVKKSYCNTNGLVGFLSGAVSNIKNGHWNDEYLYNNAEITQIDKISDSITFQNKGAGAKWPVGEKTDGQPYKFTDPGFTLVAFVTVGKVEGNNYNFILGVVTNGGETLISLWCSNDGNFAVGKGKKESPQLQTTNEICEQDTTYQVTIILDKENLTLYINGYKLSGETAGNIQIKKSDVISYFYFAADSKKQNDNTNVTVENVLLYNRPFNESEINSLKIPKKIKLADAGQVNGKETTEEQQGSGNSGNLELSEETERDGESNEFTQTTVTEEVVQTSTQQRESAVGNSVNIVNFNIVVCSVLYLLLLVGMG